jgi:hypothetical protein
MTGSDPTNKTCFVTFFYFTWRYSLKENQFMFVFAKNPFVFSLGDGRMQPNM